MKTSIIFSEVNTNLGYYELTIKETSKSIIVIERTNHTGGYDKEIRYHKDSIIMADIAYLKETGDTPWFAHKYAGEYENGSYWQSWKEVY